MTAWCRCPRPRAKNETQPSRFAGLTALGLPLAETIGWGWRFQPCARAAAEVTRADPPLRDAHAAGVPKDGRPVPGERLAELDAILHRLILSIGEAIAASFALPEPQGAHLPRPRPGSPLLGPDASASQSRTSRLPQNGRRAAYRFKGISPLLSYRNGLLRTHPRHSGSREKALYFAGPQMLGVSAVWGLFARERLMRARQSPPLEARGSSLQPGARPTTHVSRAAMPAGWGEAQRCAHRRRRRESSLPRRFLRSSRASGRMSCPSSSMRS
jgi:hypothetical protein